MSRSVASTSAPTLSPPTASAADDADPTLRASLPPSALPSRVAEVERSARSSQETLSSSASASASSAASLALRCVAAESALSAVSEELHSALSSAHRLRAELGDAQRSVERLQAQQRAVDASTVRATPDGPEALADVASLSHAELCRTVDELRRALSSLSSQHAAEVAHLLQYKFLCAEQSARLEDAELALELERAKTRKSRSVVEKCAVAQRRFEASEGQMAETVARLAQQLLEAGVQVRHIKMDAPLSLSAEPAPGEEPQPQPQQRPLEDGPAAGAAVLLPILPSPPSPAALPFHPTSASFSAARGFATAAVASSPAALSGSALPGGPTFSASERELLRQLVEDSVDAPVTAGKDHSVASLAASHPPRASPAPSPPPAPTKGSWSFLSTMFGGGAAAKAPAASQQRSAGQSPHSNGGGGPSAVAASPVSPAPPLHASP